MPPKLRDPLKDGEGKPAEAPASTPAPTPASEPKARLRTPRKPAERPSPPAAPTPAPQAPERGAPFDEALIARIKGDFRLFVILLWRHLLGVDPAPIMLDMAYWLQHGPDRSIVMAFRGFSKSWITGAYALWRLFRNPQEKILVVSGSLTRAAATTNWCLQLIMEVPWLQHLRPLPHQRQSSKAFDVGPATPDQSPSFHALGIGGQIVGFRGDCIVPDDVETQTNSLTVVMRDKIREAVKEFDSVLKPGGVIKYLGTPHDEDSLYNKLAKDAGYTIRIWPALYPNAEQQRKYGNRLAPYVRSVLDKSGPALIGTPTMPTRFSAEDLAKRLMSLGRSEFALQFMLDTSLADQDKYPLKLRDLSVLSLDPLKGPEAVLWTNDPTRRDLALPAMGLDGDYWHAGIVPEGTIYSPYTRVVASIDPSGRGADEAVLSIVGELLGKLFFLFQDYKRDGYSPATLEAFTGALVRYNVSKLRIENNFGDGMFTALLRPVLEKAWKAENTRREKRRRADPAKAYLFQDGGTDIEEVRSSSTMSKERRILSVLEPVTQQHRLVVDRSLIERDFASMSAIDGDESLRRRYTLGHQYTRLTREREALDHDDRIEGLALAVIEFADILGVDPEEMGETTSKDREEDEFLRQLGLAKVDGIPVDPDAAIDRPKRAASLVPQQR